MSVCVCGCVAVCVCVAVWPCVCLRALDRFCNILTGEWRRQQMATHVCEKCSECTKRTISRTKHASLMCCHSPIDNARDTLQLRLKSQGAIICI